MHGNGAGEPGQRSATPRRVSPPADHPGQQGTSATASDGTTLGAPPEAIPTTLWEVLREHEMERRRRLVRILTLGIMIPAVLLIPSSLFPKFIPGSLVALSIVLAGTVVAYVLNRLSYVSVAGYALIAGVAAALAWQVVSKVLLQHGVDAVDLRYYDLLVLPIMLSAVVVGRRGPIIVAACVSAFTLVSLLVLPLTPTLQQYWNDAYPYSLGSVYDVIALPVLFQWVAGVVAWLGADSIRRALGVAARADEVAAANARIVAQAREIEAQRQRLQEGMAQIQQVHAAIARGHWDARVRVEQGELLPMAMSLNLLLDRLTRLTREQSQRTQLEAAAHELALALRQWRAGAPYTPPNYTGTPFDEVLLEFNALRAAQAATRSTSGPPLLLPSEPAPTSQPSPPTLSTPPGFGDSAAPFGYPSAEEYERWRPQDGAS
jgi:hypothetical protein